MRLVVLLACVAAFSLGFMLERAAVVATTPSSSNCGKHGGCHIDRFAHPRR